MISNRSRSSKCNFLTSDNNKTAHPKVDNSQLAINKCVSALFFVQLEVPSVLHYSAGVIKGTRRTTSLSICFEVDQYLSLSLVAQCYSEESPVLALSAGQVRSGDRLFREMISLEIRARSNTTPLPNDLERALVSKVRCSKQRKNKLYL